MKYAMHTLKTAASAVILSSWLFLAGCDAVGGDDDDAGTEAIEGLWSLAAEPGQYVHIDGSTLTFYYRETDSEFVENAPCYYSETGTIENAGGNEYEIRDSDDETETETITITVSGNTMTVSETDGGETFTEVYQRSSLDPDTFTPECIEAMPQ